MVKVMVQMYPVVRAESTEERKKLRPLGRNKERFQEAMDGMLTNLLFMFLILSFYLQLNLNFSMVFFLRL